MKIRRLLIACAGSLMCGTVCSQTTILRTVNDRLAREFISHDGLLLDYVGEIPTPEEIADLKPNEMGWQVPCDGPFKGQKRGKLNGTGMPFWCVTRFLYLLQSLSELTGDAHWAGLYDCRGGTDGRADQEGPADPKARKVKLVNVKWRK